MLSNEFLVGCDPEFVALGEDGEPIEYPGVTAGHDESPFGWDHGGRVLELRPDPSKNISTIMRRLQKLILESDFGLRKYKWQGGAVVAWNDGQARQPLGGHIHLDIPYGSERMDLVLPALDQVIRHLEGVDILPEKASQARREIPVVPERYGLYGQVRDCKGHMEYRTPPSWLYCPRVAFVTMTGIKIAAVYPKDTYRYFAVRNPSAAAVVNYFGKYRDINCQQAAELVRVAQGRDTEADIKQVWKKIPE